MFGWILDLGSWTELKKSIFGAGSAEKIFGARSVEKIFGARSAEKIFCAVSKLEKKQKKAALKLGVTGHKKKNKCPRPGVNS